MRFHSAKQMRWYLFGVIIIMCVIALTGRTYVVAALRRSSDAGVRVFSSMIATIRGVSHDETAAERALMQERDELKTRVALLESDNAALRRQLQYPAPATWRMRGADVIAKASDAAQQGLIINRGSSDGIAMHQPVITDTGVFVGEIIRVEPSRSVVRLPSDRRSRVGALLAKNSKPIGIVEGGYGLGMRVSLIPPQEVVTRGDVVITSGAVEHIPRGLLIGRIVAVGGERFEPFQHAVLEPTIPFEEMRQVQIIVAVE